MNDSAAEIWFWQRIVSPHMAALAAALAELGCRVVFVAETDMSTERSRQGWIPANLGRADLELATGPGSVRSLADRAASASLHICQGVRANGFIKLAQRALAVRRLRQLVVMEAVDDAGPAGLLKRPIYRRLLRKWRSHIDCVLAIGRNTPKWVADRGFESSRVFPFAYFLAEPRTDGASLSAVRERFRILYAGRLVRLKRVDLLIRALSEVSGPDFELVIVGSGPEANRLRSMANRTLTGAVTWLGRLPMPAVHEEMRRADCLVLPSSYDGWGAVVSEALMRGVPVVASEACGASVAVESSGVGGVFAVNDVGGLRDLLAQMICAGKLSPEQRNRIAHWARCLGADVGAKYFMSLATHLYDAGPLPSAPWVSGP